MLHLAISHLSTLEVEAYLKHTTENSCFKNICWPFKTLVRPSLCAKGNQTLELKIFLGEHRENYTCVFAIFQPFLIFIPEHFPFLTFPIVSSECIVVVKGQQGFSSLELNALDNLAPIILMLLL